jgi:hypothetical protein
MKMHLQEEPKLTEQLAAHLRDLRVKDPLLANPPEFWHNKIIGVRSWSGDRVYSWHRFRNLYPYVRPYLHKDFPYKLVALDRDWNEPTHVSAGHEYYWLLAVGGIFKQCFFNRIVYILNKLGEGTFEAIYEDPACWPTINGRKLTQADIDRLDKEESTSWISHPKNLQQWHSQSQARIISRREILPGMTAGPSTTRPDSRDGQVELRQPSTVTVRVPAIFPDTRIVKEVNEKTIRALQTDCHHHRQQGGEETPREHMFDKRAWFRALLTFPEGEQRDNQHKLSDEAWFEHVLMAVKGRKETTDQRAASIILNAYKGRSRAHLSLETWFEDVDKFISSLQEAEEDIKVSLSTTIFNQDGYEELMKDLWKFFNSATIQKQIQLPKVWELSCQGRKENEK